MHQIPNHGVSLSQKLNTTPSVAHLAKEKISRIGTTPNVAHPNEKKNEKKEEEKRESKNNSKTASQL